MRTPYRPDLPPRGSEPLTAPTSSNWINQVDRWFGFITDELIRRGKHQSVQALEVDIHTLAKGGNETPQTIHLAQRPPNKSSSQSDDFLYESLRCGTLDSGDAEALELAIEG